MDSISYDAQLSESLHPIYGSVNHYYYLQIISKTIEKNFFRLLKEQSTEKQRKYNSLFGKTGFLTQISEMEWELYKELSYDILIEIEKDLSIIESYYKELLKNDPLKEYDLIKENIDWLQEKYKTILQFDINDKRGL